MSTYGFAKTDIAVRTTDGHNCVLLEDLVYVAADGRTFTALAGSDTDGASTPQAVWTILPPFGPYWLATVLHDFNYRCTQLPREECDDLLLEAMASLGVNFATRETIYRAVRTFGEKAFDADRAAQQPEHLNMVRISPPR